MITHELERAGIPVVQVCNVYPAATPIGVTRMYFSPRIKYPLGVVDVDADIEHKKRVQMVEGALNMLKE